MKRPLFLATSLVLSMPAIAQAAECALARDPARCEARQSALNICADQYGAARNACLDANMPPIDCAKTADPPRCAAIEKARQVCKSKTGKEQKACLKEQAPKKKKAKS